MRTIHNNYYQTRTDKGLMRTQGFMTIGKTKQVLTNHLMRELTRQVNQMNETHGETGSTEDHDAIKTKRQEFKVKEY